MDEMNFMSTSNIYNNKNSWSPVYREFIRPGKPAGISLANIK